MWPPNSLMIYFISKMQECPDLRKIRAFLQDYYKFFQTARKHQLNKKVYINKITN